MKLVICGIFIGALLVSVSIAENDKDAITERIEETYSKLAGEAGKGKSIIEKYDEMLEMYV